MDAKSYPYIEYISKPYPKLKISRYLNAKKKDNRYLFGPYPNAYAARRIVNLINRLYPLKKCDNKKELCLYYHIGECLGYCSKELDKEDALRTYFDDWGSRCYVFSAELFKEGNQFLCSKLDDLSVNHLEINTEALKKLGCQYIFSAVDIQNYKDLNLAYINCYTTDLSFWNIRVYKLN